jgi:hypothetical protein
MCYFGNKSKILLNLEYGVLRSTNKLFVLIYSESGLDCDHIIVGKTQEDFFKNGAGTFIIIYF